MLWSFRPVYLNNRIPNNELRVEMYVKAPLDEIDGIN